MGNYNPTAPIVLGEEWVGIRAEDLALAPGVDIDERGHTFTLAQSRTLADARFYVADQPNSFESNTYFAHVYPRGTEDQSGPVKRVLIPCNNGFVTGGGTSISGATTYAQAVFSPSDNAHVIGWTGGGGGVGFPPSVWVSYFATNSFAQTLQGKRILGVNVMYCLGTLAYILPLVDRPSLYLGLGNSSASFVNFYPYGFTDGGNNSLGNLNNSQGAPTIAPSRLSLGTVNQFWSSTLSPILTPDRMPWTYGNLQRMEQGSTGAYAVIMTGIAEGDTIAQSFLQYLALEVVYCEEKRVAVGGSAFDTLSNAYSRQWVLNTNKVTMRDPLTAALNPVLAAGEYSLTLSVADQAFRNPTGHADLNGLRELDNIPLLDGVLIDVPFPLDDTVDDKQFSEERTVILPQLSLHTSGAPLTEVHVYGRQAHAPVYGSITATQEILDAPAGGATSFPQVRFFARRFGETSVPLLLDSPTIPASSASLTPTEFDALPEILDGWKEIRLRFATPPSMGTGTNPQWRFSAAGETGGNQWQVLGMTAPALSGIPSNFNNPVPTGQQLGTATYGAPSAGTTINLGWMSPLVSSTTEDNNSDAALLFSPDPPTVSGFGVEVTTQELSTVDPSCFAAPCVPTGLLFNELTWTVQPPAAFDDFDDRTLASSWGTASRAGGLWANSGGAASDYNVSNGNGSQQLTATESSRRSVLPGVAKDVDIHVIVSSPVAASGSAIRPGLMARHLDSNNYYWAEVQFTATQTINVTLNRIVAGVGASLATVTIAGAHTAGSLWNLRFQVNGDSLRARAWLYPSDEPPNWQVSVVDTTLTTAGQVGIRSLVTAGNLNLPATLNYTQFQALPYGFGAYEIERFDAVDGEFFTIALATDATLGFFNDYEARVGYESVYRIRATNSYDFAGLWSPQITATITVPGVVGGDTSLLIFTTNSTQDGSGSLAYSSAWESGVPSEEYLWPEAGTVVLQDMYGKDYPTAFRPLERGGERFARQILVNASGVPTAQTQHGFESLRDMAWNDVPYVCVRNEDGDRWYATVIVPSGSVRRMIVMGRLCMAAVQVIEVTDTPFPVDP